MNMVHHGCTSSVIEVCRYCRMLPVHCNYCTSANQYRPIDVATVGQSPQLLVEATMFNVQDELSV